MFKVKEYSKNTINNYVLQVPIVALNKNLTIINFDVNLLSLSSKKCT
jgi:hypothetical protein